ncbi:MAG: 16S rRNA (cytosine(1402)-N(4))-methyltransferase RsmH [Syntrophomonadaceae bacterium]|nr:16S rRNA (cytosine(1402)-N(4))-methyltransferase RsmH [Syntrophomonadaceae bacterium]
MHLPVLLNQTIDYLVTDPQGIYVDCTLGGGGHLRELLTRLDKEARVIAIDKDKDILSETMKTFDAENVTFVHSDFRQLSSVLKGLNIDQVNGVLMDLGVSSFQLDEGERGFSFHEDADLDMRMNREENFSAADLVNTYSEEDIADVLWRYGEEKYSRRIARAIVESRKEKPIKTTLELVEIIKAAVPASYRREKHPARKSFQAIRIAVNKELDALIEVLPQAVDVLMPGGRLCVITFHSLEDRIVKHFFQENSKECICPSGLPICTCEHKPRLKIETRKPCVPDEDECKANFRARSAKLRVATKL